LELLPLSNSDISLKRCNTLSILNFFKSSSIDKKQAASAVNKELNHSKLLFIKIAASKHLSRLYLLVSAIILGLSTYFWAALGALTHNNNSDQLINVYLFHSTSTLKDALLPSAHTFLIKWPLYFLINVFGAKPGTLVLLTVVSVLLTVGGLAFILSRIERRPIVLGTLFLLLASVLMLVPSTPYPGSLLPVNMAMLATRNLEYIVYIASLWLFIKYPKVRDWRFWLGIVLLGPLIASDKLFLSISLGAALTALVVYSLTNGWNLVSLSAKWLIGALLGALSAVGIIQILKSLKVTHIVGDSGLGPYGLVHNLHDLILGAAYAALLLATNLGANPASNTTVLRNVPNASIHHIFSLSGFALIINILFASYALYCAGQIIIHSLRHNKNRDNVLPESSKLALALLWSSLTAIVLFTASKHYWAGDARYLTIALFALFISVAAYVSQREWQYWKMIFIGTLAAIGLVLSVPGVIKNYNTNQVVFNTVNNRNDPVIEAIHQHKVDVLVGDYWRVIPAKFNSHDKTKIMPLASCTDPKGSLTRTDWSYDLKKNSFAYLLTLDGGLSDFPHCSLQQVVNSYGRPNSSVVLAGNFANPKEILLFYDHGANKSAPITPQPAQGPSTVVPISLADLPYKSCTVPTIMNIVAHQDDDLLFMNPDLPHDLNAGHCVRSVYMTAGDAGGSQFYWLSRQQGTEAAYSTLLGTADIWVERIVAVSPHQFITIANPRGNSKISLIFMYLPDGNIKGQGFPSTKFESLARLNAGQIPAMDAVYTGSSYTAPQLDQALTDLMHLYLPTEIRTQSNMNGTVYPDHSDHMAVGKFVQRAYVQYEQTQYENKVTIPISYYLGYPGHELPPNVFGEELSLKEAAFIEYSKHDGGVCHNLNACLRDPAYGAYLTRQYKVSY
jgi:LmbE family N-acetylglucosaminyl deacetylase